MLQGIFLAIITGLCFATGAGLFASVARTRLPFLTFLAIGASIGLVLALLFLVDWSATKEATRVGELSLWICAGAIANVAGHRAITQAMVESRAPVAWAISQGGQTIPFVASTLIWGETPGPWPWLGVVIILCGVALLALSRDKGSETNVSHRGVAFALLAFLCYGINNLLMSVPSHWSNWADVMHLRVPLTLAVFCMGGALCGKGWSTATLRRILPRALGYGLLLVICFGCIYAAIDRLESTGCAGIFWPLASGTGIAAYALWERVTSQQKVVAAHLIGLVLVVLGIAALATSELTQS